MTKGHESLGSVIDGGRVSAYQVAIFGLCALIAMMDGFDTQCIAFVAPEIASVWGVDPSAFGAVFGVGLLGGLLGALVFGWAGDRYGRKPALLVAILIFAVGSAATPLASTIPHLVAMRFATGIGLGGALPSFISLTSEYAPERRRASLVGLMFCGFPLGAVVGGVASAKLIPAFGWESVFLLAGALPLAVLPLVAIFVPESLQYLATRGRLAPIERILRRMGRLEAWNGELDVRRADRAVPVSRLFAGGMWRGTLLLWAALFLSLILTYFLVNWLPIVARQTGEDVQGSVLAVAFLNLGAVLGCAVLSRLADRFGQVPVIASAFLAGAFAIGAIGQAGHSRPVLFLATFAAGFLSIGAQMCAVAFCANFYETAVRATGIGWAMGVGRIGAIIGPLVGGLLLSMHVATPTLFIVAGTTSLGSAIATSLIGRLMARRRPAAAGIESIVSATAGGAL